MKKLKRTYLMGIVFLLLSVFVVWQTAMIPERLVSNEPGPKFFPFISAGGMALFAVLSMIFDGKKEKEEDEKEQADKGKAKRLVLILAEALAFCVAMQLIGFWLASMLGSFMFIWTLKGEKKINVVPAVVFSIVLGCICYFGFTRGFHIPLPTGSIWRVLDIRMP